MKKINLKLRVSFESFYTVSCCVFKLNVCVFDENAFSIVFVSGRSSGRLKQIENYAFTNENGYAWTTKTEAFENADVIHIT